VQISALCFPNFQFFLMLQRLHQLRRWAGLDRAVLFSNATQAMRLFTGPITMALVLRYLTPEIQGYFYAFSGVVAMQIFLEMGFSQNILQFASHEFSKLRFAPDGTLEGDPVARSRLISLGRLAFGYYAVAAVIVLFAIGIGGFVFFTVSDHHNAARLAAAGGKAMQAASSMPVPWQTPWVIIVVCAALGLAINPAWALLEGCNQVPAVALYRLCASLTSFSVGAIALPLGAGIYVSAIGSVVGLLVALGYLGLRWRHFFRQFLAPPRHGSISWRHEIWPFQWRIAISWASGYFIFDILNPIAFYFCGPVMAGRFGMSLQLVRMIMFVALTWVSTKAPRFGMLVAARAWTELDSLWRRCTIQAFIACVLGETLMLASIPFIGHVLPRLPARLAPWDVSAWLASNMILQLLVSSFAMELRAHKREPYMWLSVAGAVLTSGLMLLLTPYFGIRGEAIGYALAAWILFIPALNIYRVKRREFRQEADARHAPLPPEPVLEIDPNIGGIS
jgi:O-antigen/teichoic acid export membrane protein